MSATGMVRDSGAATVFPLFSHYGTAKMSQPGMRCQHQKREHRRVDDEMRQGRQDGADMALKFRNCHKLDAKTWQNDRFVPLVDLLRMSQAPAMSLGRVPA